MTEYQSHHKLPPRSDIGKMPPWVPVFTAGDMTACRSHYGKRHCASGWSAVLGLPGGEFGQAYKRANGDEVITHNDLTCKTDQERADALNAAMVKLGIPQNPDA